MTEVIKEVTFRSITNVCAKVELRMLKQLSRAENVGLTANDTCYCLSKPITPFW